MIIQYTTVRPHARPFGLSRESQLPRAIEAFFFIADDTNCHSDNVWANVDSSEGRHNHCEGYARRAQQAFLQRYRLTAEDVPLLRLDPHADGPTPFTLADPPHGGVTYITEDNDAAVAAAEAASAARRPAWTGERLCFGQLSAAFVAAGGGASGRRPSLTVYERFCSPAVISADRCAHRMGSESGIGEYQEVTQPVEHATREPQWAASICIPRRTSTSSDSADDVYRHARDERPYACFDIWDRPDDRDAALLHSGCVREDAASVAHRNGGVSEIDLVDYALSGWRHATLKYSAAGLTQHQMAWAWAPSGLSVALFSL